MKHHHAGGRRDAVGRLSPANCGGLIEAGRDSLAAVTIRILSPANCGGLIEADAASPRIVGHGELSPANCGGLIEAA